MESVPNNGNETKQESTLYLAVGVLSLLSALWVCAWRLIRHSWHPTLGALVPIIASTALAVAAFVKIRKPAACIGCLFALIVAQCCGNLLQSFSWPLGVLGDVFYCLGYIMLAVTLFAGLRKPAIGVGFLLVGVGYIFPLIRVCKVIGGYVGRYGFDIVLIMQLLYEGMFISAMAVSAVMVFLLFSQKPEAAEKAKKIWFLPGIFGIIGSVAYLAYFINVFREGTILGAPVAVTFVITAVEPVALFLAAKWLAYPDGLPKHIPKKPVPTSQADADQATSQKSANAELQKGYQEGYQEGYYELWKHVLLLLFTFGVWQFIWIYKATDYLNRVKGEEYRDPTKKLLLCLFVPFYSIYWIYKSAQRIDKLAAEKKVSSDLATLCLILGIFIPVVALILMQDKINAIITAKGSAQSAGAPTMQNESAPQIGTADEIQKYKSLLDQGVITQEEFEAKKKQLLGL